MDCRWTECSIENPCKEREGFMNVYEENIANILEEEIRETVFPVLRQHAFEWGKSSS